MNTTNEKPFWIDVPVGTEMLSVAEAARRLNIGVSTYYHWAAQKRVPPPLILVENGRASRVAENHLMAFVRDRWGASLSEE